MQCIIIPIENEHINKNFKKCQMRVNEALKTNLKETNQNFDTKMKDIQIILITNSFLIPIEGKQINILIPIVNIFHFEHMIPN